MEQIVAVARAQDGLRGGRQSVTTLAEDRQKIADGNGELLTTLAQPIDYAGEDQIDWDHIFPAAQANRMWAPGSGRRRHHPDRRLVNTAGNLWALHASTNRSLQDTLPKPKFALLRAWDADPATRERVWERARWSLSDAEIDGFIHVDELLDDDPAHIDQATNLFATLVVGRTSRLLDEALERFPQARLFAPDADVLPTDASRPHGFGAQLGLSGAVAPGQQPGKLEARCSDTGWAGREEEMREVTRQTVKALTGDRRRLPIKQYPGFEFAAYGEFTVNNESRCVASGVSNEISSNAATPFWLHVNAATDGFEESVARLLDSRFGQDLLFRAAPTDGREVHAWLPLHALPGLQGKELGEHLTLQARDVLDAIAPAARTR